MACTIAIPGCVRWGSDMPINGKAPVILFLLAAAVWAQFGSGFQGTVVDRSGAIVPGVAIRVTNIDTGVTREVLSGYAGIDVGHADRHTGYDSPATIDDRALKSAAELSPNCGREQKQNDRRFSINRHVTPPTNTARNGYGTSH